MKLPNYDSFRQDEDSPKAKEEENLNFGSKHSSSKSAFSMFSRKDVGELSCKEITNPII